MRMDSALLEQDGEAHTWEMERHGLSYVMVRHLPRTRAME
jgi:hypothetical protein